MISRAKKTSILPGALGLLFWLTTVGSNPAEVPFGSGLGPKVEACEVVEQNPKWTIRTCEVAGSPFLASVAETKVAVSHNKMVGLIKEAYGRCMDWMANCIERKQLARRGNRYTYYSALGMPWPLKDRDAVVEVHYQTRSKVTAAELDSVDGGYPEREGRVRVGKMQALWHITDLGGKSQAVRYVVHIDPAGNIPAALVNPFLGGMMDKAMKMLHYALGLGPKS